MSRDVPADSGFLRDEAHVIGETTKETQSSRTTVNFLGGTCSINYFIGHIWYFYHVFRRISTVQIPVVALCTTKFNTLKFYVLHTQCVYMFCVDLRTNSDYFTVQH